MSVTDCLQILYLPRWHLNLAINKFLVKKGLFKVEIRYLTTKFASESANIFLWAIFGCKLGKLSYMFIANSALKLRFLFACAGLYVTTVKVFNSSL